MSLTPAPFLCFDFGLLDASGAAPPGPFALVSFLASLVLGLLYESSEVCFFCLNRRCHGTAAAVCEHARHFWWSSVVPWKYVGFGGI